MEKSETSRRGASELPVRFAGGAGLCGWFAVRLTRLRKSATKGRKSFLQGLKPVESTQFTSALKHRPPEEKTFSAACYAGRSAAKLRVNKLLLIREDSYGSQNLSHKIGIRDRGADESA
jgi:hypothetical protein